MNDDIIINFLLDKQSLIIKKSANQLIDLVHHQLGLHSTDYMTPYISLWNRIKDFDPKELFNSLNNFEVLRKRSYRGTVFVIDANLLPIINTSSKIFAVSWFKGFEKQLTKMNIDFNPFIEETKKQFKKHKELTVRELKNLIADKNLLPKKMISLALRYLELDGLLVRTTHRYLKDKVIRYGLTEIFYPEISNNPMDIDVAINELFIRYLKQYGPITIDDFAWWLPATKTTTKQLVEKFKEEITEILFNNQTYLIHNVDFKKLQNYKKHDETQIVNFLPYEDHFPKSYTNRKWFLSEILETIMIGQERMTMGQLWPSIWLNGKIIGKWEIIYQNKAKTKAEIEITHLENKSKIPKTTIDLIKEQQKNLEQFINDQLLPLNKKKK